MDMLPRKEFLKRHREYLSSKEWADIRNDLFEIRGRKCERCGCKWNLQVHHLSYENWMMEEPNDLEVLCKGCHDSEHKKASKKRKPPKRKRKGRKYKGIRLSSKD